MRIYSLEKRTAKSPKVFEVQIGFFNVVVAVPSQVAALRALGVHQNLFASGDARVSTDPEAMRAARLQPGVPLRRAIGSNDTYQLQATSLPTLPDSPERKPGLSRVRANAPKPARPPADRRCLDAAVAALDALNGRRKDEEAKILQEEKAVATKRDEAMRRYTDAKKTAEAAVETARTAYERVRAGS